MPILLPSVSILIANFNGREHLEKGLPSLLTQTYPADRVEIIVVDNGSTDESIAFLQQEYPEIRIIRNAQNEGFARANNQGAAIASGEYLALINNDMVAKADWLEQLMATRLHSGAECIAGIILNRDGTKIDFVDAGMTPFGFASQLHYEEPVENLKQYAREKELFFACGGSMMISRAIFLNLGGFDEDFFCYYEDADMGFRLWVTGHRVVLAPGAITYHSHNGTSQALSPSERRILVGRNRLFLVLKNFDETRYWKYLVGLMLKMFIDICCELRIYLMQPTENAEAMNEIHMRTEAWLGFVRKLPVMRLKRQQIQAARKRSDQEVMRLMDRPAVHVAACLEQVRDFVQAYLKSFSR